ncbi:GNAT family N-acetyltransferase [Leifsonia sp. 21MFCrub1.1]|uniref:GNAT family N-acetyltransferase n=1 Tax=Leifsonia sp. 21MFCrub1.1 TaxID=1798223 RepID=UPI0008929993|nr:GNAT family N-acetyltransferase [Leifsonia sp. 21MFCrub1.1]SEB01659.1 Protein N-acetyltransferase, RimJ/RimL family [Leifsonia sp. 21MFCrub1.1]
MPAPVVLTGARVTLSTPGHADVDRIAEVCADPAIARWTTVPSPYTRDNAVGFVTSVVPDGWASGRVCTWAVRAEGALVGMISIGDIHEHQGEIGYWMAPEARGHGIMSEAAALVIGYGFAPAPDGLALRRLVWRALAGNAASAAVARRAGFRWDGIVPGGAEQRGERFDEWRGTLLPADAGRAAGDWPDVSYVQAPA